MQCKVLQGLNLQEGRNNTMEQDNNKILSVLHAGSLRGLVEQVNSINSEKQVISKDNIVQILNIEDGFYMLYFK